MEKGLSVTLSYIKSIDMRCFYLLLLLSLLCCSCKQPKEVPADFYFRIDDGVNDSYDSKEGLFYREFWVESESYDEDSVLVKTLSTGKKEFPLKLNKEDYKEIYNFYKRINFHNLPSVLKKRLVQDPNFDTSLEICEEGVCNRVETETVDLSRSIKYEKEYLLYKGMSDVIWRIIMKKDEYKNIPSSDIVYW